MTHDVCAQVWAVLMDGLARSVLPASPERRVREVYPDYLGSKAAQDREEPQDGQVCHPMATRMLLTFKLFADKRLVIISNLYGLHFS